MKPARLAILSICVLAGAAGCSLGDDPAAAGPIVTPSAPAPSTAAQAATTTTTQPVAAPAKAKRLNAFQTPSGNIACLTSTWTESDGSVRCDASQFTYSPPPKPDYCDTDWGHAFSIEPNGSVDVLCAGDTVFDPDHPKPVAGTSVAIGESVCEVQTRSIRCVVEGTDGGLFLSSERYEIF